jgi:hypothetical protein
VWDSENYFPGWPWTVILPISVFQVARVTGLSYQHPALCCFYLNQLTTCLWNLLCPTDMFIFPYIDVTLSWFLCGES